MPVRTEVLDELAPDRVVRVPLSLIKPDPDQPRRVFDPARLEDLAADIAANGVIQPIVVYRVGKGAMIKVGERRWRAAKLAKLGTIPCILASDERAESGDAAVERAIAQLAENQQRDEISPLELAGAFARLHDVHGLSDKAIADTLQARGWRACSRPYVANLRRLTELDEAFQEQIRQGAVSPSAGKHLLVAQRGGDAVRKHVEDLIRRRRGTGARPDQPPLPVTVVEHLVEDSFDAIGINLDEGGHVEGISGYVTPAFDTAACATAGADGKACPHLATLGRGDNRQRFCMHIDGFLEKQRAAEAARADAAGRADPGEQGTLEADLGADPDVPSAARQASTDELRGAGERWLLEHVRARVRAQIADGDADETRFALLLWAATHDSLISFRWHGFLEQHELASLERAVSYALRESSGQALDRWQRAVAGAVIDCLGEQDVWCLVDHLRIDLTEYRVEQTFLETRRKSELVELLRHAGVDSTAAMKVQDLRDLCVTHADQIGVPAVVAKAFDLAVEGTRLLSSLEANDGTASWHEELDVVDDAGGDEADTDG